MQDGFTRKLPRSEAGALADDFFAQHQVHLVLLTGPAAGSERAIAKSPCHIGRGPDVELAFDDAAMSREHAVIETADGGLRVRDLGSTNGVVVNGAATLVASLKHGDKLQIGEHGFQLVIERKAGGATYEL